VKQKWTGIVAVAFVLLFVAVIPASAAGAPSWSSPVDVSAIGQHADNPQIVAVSKGSLAAIWEGTDGTNTVVQASRSKDSGATWATPVTLSASGQSPFFPDIVAAPNGSVTAVWELSNAGNNTVQASHSANGASWSAPFDLATFSGEASSPQIVAAPDGTVTAVWQGQSNVIQSSHSVNGTSWSALTAFPNAGWGGMSPQIASATDSSLTAVWSSFDGSSYIVQSSHSADGSSWSAPSQIAVAGGTPASPQSVVGPSGTLTVVWNQTNGVIQASHSADGGLTWDAPATLSGAGADPPHIALAPDGTLAAVWDRSDGSNYIVQSSHSSDGSTWSAAADLSTAGLSAVNPQIVAGSDSALTVAWSSFDSSNSYIIQTSHSVDNGTSWDPVTDLSSPGPGASAPQLVAASNGAVTAVWSRFDGTNYAIQSAFTVIPPVFTAGALPAPTVGVAYSFQLSASGVPAPTFGITTGALAAGLTLSSTGLISGKPTAVGTSSFAVTASNGAAPDAVASYTLTVGSGVPPIIPHPVPSTSAVAPAVPTPPTIVNPTPQLTTGPTPQPMTSPTPEHSVSPVIVAPVLQIGFGFTVGESADGGELIVTGNGFLPDSFVIITLHSTPTTLGTIAISSTGSFEQTLTLPTDLETGVHHVEVAYPEADGGPTSQSLYFSVNKSDVVTNMQSQPTDSPPSWAQTATQSTVNSGPGTRTLGGVTYERYVPALHPAASVDTVVSSLVLLTILGGVGAVSAFAAGGSIAMAGAAAGGLRETTPRSPAEGSKGASLASAKVKHLKFKLEAVARGDKSSTWDWLGSERLDTLSAALPIALNRFSPLLARVSNDGAYLRAMFGPLWLVSSLVGIVLGVLSVASTHGAAVPPVMGLIIAIIVLSAFDVLGGLLAASTFTIGVIVLGGLTTIAEARTLLGIDVIFFTVALTASAARPLRRLPAVSASDWFDRVADVVVASLIATWAVTKMIGALPALAGLALPIADSALTVALCAGGSIVLRYVLESVATYHYPLRLASVAPPKIGFPSIRQQLVSAVGKTALFVFIAIAYLGNIWPLWVGAALFLIPSVIAAFQTKLPNVPRLVKLIPGGVIKIVLMLIVGKLLAGWLASSVHDPQDFIDLAFVILSIPSLLLGFAGFFGRDGKKWELNWPIRIGGVFVVIVGVLLVLGVVSIP
jgi:hypothetical protein